MGRFYFLLICLLIVPELVGAQVSISASFGYGSYSMEDLKAHQQELQAQFPVDAKITESFPAYWYFEGGGNYSFPSNFFVGGTIGYGSTGGKINYQDYSGEMDCEHKVNYIAVGFPAGYRHSFQNDKMNIQFELSPTMYFGNTRLDVITDVGPQKEVQSLTFLSTNIGLRPAIRLERSVGPVGIFFQGGYYIDLYRSDLKYKENTDYFLLNNQGDAVHATFSGFRAALGVSYGLE